MTVVLEATDLRLRGSGGRARLDDISLTLREGEWHVLLGANGAGKSSLLRSLAGEQAFDGGTVRFRGRSLDQWTPAALAERRASLSQQELLTFPFTALEVVQLGRWQLGDRLRALQRGECEALMSELDVLALAARPYPELSGGEQRRVQLARVLFQAAQHARPLVLLDEPLASLDLPHQHTVMALLQRRVQSGWTVLAALHDLDLAARHASHLHLLREGKAMASALPVRALTPTLLSATFGESLRFEAVPINGGIHWRAEPCRSADEAL